MQFGLYSYIIKSSKFIYNYYLKQIYYNSVIFIIQFQVFLIQLEAIYLPDLYDACMTDSVRYLEGMIMLQCCIMYNCWYLLLTLTPTITLLTGYGLRSVCVIFIQVSNQSLFDLDYSV